MGLFEDYWKTNFRSSFIRWQRSQAVFGLGLALLLSGLWVMTAVGLVPWTVTEFGVVTGITLGILFVVLEFIVTPVRMWIDLSNQSANLEQSIRPKLQIVGVEEEATDSLGRGWGIVVRNGEIAVASGCSAKIEDLAFETPKVQSLKLWAAYKPLHWAGQESESYEIPGGQTARLNIVYYEYVEGFPLSCGKRLVTLAYRGNDKSGSPITYQRTNRSSS